MKSRNNSNDGNMLIPLAIGFAVSVAICFIFMLIFALFLSKRDSNETLALVLSFISQTLGALVGGFVSAKLNRQNGLIVGLANGGILFLVYTILSMVISGASLTLLTLIRLLLLEISSMLGGILGVNINKKPKLI